MASIPPLQMQLHRPFDAEERCTLSADTIYNIANQRFADGTPHILAFVEDLEGGEDVYDASQLLRHFTVNGGTNPNTRNNCLTVTYLAAKTWAQGYFRLCKQIYSTETNKPTKVILDLFVHNIVHATEGDNPYAYHSLDAVICHYEERGNRQAALEWKQILFEQVQRHFGQGIAILVLPIILSEGRSRDELLSFVLDKSLDLSEWNHFLEASSINQYLGSLGETTLAQLDRNELLTHYADLLSEPDQPLVEFMAAYYSFVAERDHHFTLEGAITILTGAYELQPCICALLGYCLSLTGDHERAYNKMMLAWDDEHSYIRPLCFVVQQLLEKDELEQDDLQFIYGCLMDAKGNNPNDPYFIETYLMARLRNCVELLDEESDASLMLRALQVHRFKPKMLLQYSTHLLDEGEVDYAMELLKLAHRFAPNDAAILDELGNALLMRSRHNRCAESFQECLQVWEQAVQLDPENTELLIKLGRKHCREIPNFRAGINLQRGIQLLRQAMMQDPDNHEVKLMLADALLRCSDIADRMSAGTLLGHVHFDEDSTCYPHFKLAQARYYLRSGLLDLARAAIEASLSAESRDTSLKAIRLTLKSLLVIQQRDVQNYEQAIAWLERAIIREPNYAQPYRLLWYMCRHGLGMEQPDPVRCLDIEQSMPELPADEESMIRYVTVAEAENL